MILVFFVAYHPAQDFERREIPATAQTDMSSTEGSSLLALIVVNDNADSADATPGDGM